MKQNPVSLEHGGFSSFALSGPAHTHTHGTRFIGVLTNNPWPARAPAARAAEVGIRKEHKQKST
jgi:hypothetical protein